MSGENKALSAHVFYRIFKWLRRIDGNDNRINLPFGYYFDLWLPILGALSETLQKSQNQKDHRRAMRLQFYQRWFDPVILPVVIRVRKLWVS